MDDRVYDTMKSTSKKIAERLTALHGSVGTIETTIAGVTITNLTMSDYPHELMIDRLSNEIYEAMVHHQLNIRVHLFVKFSNGLRGILNRCRDTGNLEFEFLRDRSYGD